MVDITHLGSGAKYDTYDNVRPDLLNPIERKRYTDNPVFGFDVWNCYEVSALKNDGYPVNGILRFTYDCNSPFIIESKSMKLYLNSFNMARIGNTNKEVAEYIEQYTADYLSRGLKTTVHVRFYDLDDHLLDMDPVSKYAFTSCDHFSVKSNILRSNCRVTNQPDWADMLMVSSHKWEKEKVDSVLIAMRNEMHFHEEVTEMLFHNFDTEQDLLVACFYTRRGGIDINPVRASNLDMLKYVRHNNLDFLQKKTWRQ